MGYLRKKRYFYILFIIGLGILFSVIFISSTFGSADISLRQFSMVLFRRLPFIKDILPHGEIIESHETIILNIRLPRIILAGLVGMGLSVVGAAFQGIFKNPMADPYVIGISSGAGLGATIAIVLGLNSTVLGFGFISLGAFFGAFLTVIMVYKIAKTGARLPTITLLLSGIAISQLWSSIMSILMIFNRNQIEKIIFWVMGSVSTASWRQVVFLTPFVVLGNILLWVFSRDLNVLLMGDETAKTLGIEIEKVKKILIIICSILIGAVVSVSGLIGFVGLVIPHIMRMLIGADNRVLIPFSALGGSIFLIICDTLSRTLIAPSEIPVGAVTALFGAPYFIYLLYKHKKVAL
ncbi:MAG: iron chelate uptake ABC transporter family permease subunit [Epulopiscium sp.]|nr:iron chelate uptake ABC transporter family permease subunit [Candidatus Epulonipiscium sp.]